MVELQQSALNAHAMESAPVRTEGLSVVVIEPDRMNLLGLMLSSLLDRRAADPTVIRHARAVRGDVLLEASGMQATLHFEPGRIEIRRRSPERPRAEIRGTLTALLGAALGRGRLRSIVTGQLRVRGRPLTLWHVLAMVRA